MTDLPLNRPNTATSFSLIAMWRTLTRLLPAATPIDGERAQRLNTLRAEARANADRLLR